MKQNFFTIPKYSEAVVQRSSLEKYLEKNSSNSQENAYVRPFFKNVAAIQPAAFSRRNTSKDISYEL